MKTKKVETKITWYKHLYIDGESGKFSSTTLRTWLLFWLLFFYSCFLAVSVLLDLFLSNTKNFTDAFNLLEIFGLLFAGGGSLYLGKRITQKDKIEKDNL